MDETPWPVKGIKEWLWVFTNADFCLFRASDTRSRAELEDQLGSEYGGVLSNTVHLLSVVQTCRRQGRSVINFFEQGLMAIAGQASTPSLIPTSNT